MNKKAERRIFFSELSKYYYIYLFKLSSVQFVYSYYYIYKRKSLNQPYEQLFPNFVLLTHMTNSYDFHNSICIMDYTIQLKRTYHGSNWAIEKLRTRPVQYKDVVEQTAFVSRRIWTIPGGQLLYKYGSVMAVRGNGGETLKICEKNAAVGWMRPLLREG